jgi:hypothetical protein
MEWRLMSTARCDSDCQLQGMAQDSASVLGASGLTHGKITGFTVWQQEQGTGTRRCSKVQQRCGEL